VLEHIRGHYPVMLGAESFEHMFAGDTACLLLHGFTASPQAMRELGSGLAVAGIANRCPLLPGHGTVCQELNRTPWSVIEEEVQREFDRLHKKYKKVFLVGESSGAVLALRLAMRNPTRVAGIVSVGGSLRFPMMPFLPVLLPIMERLQPMPLKRNGADVCDRSALKDRVAYRHIPIHAFRELVGLAKDTTRQLHKITQPLLIQQSPHDHAVAPSSALLLYDRTKSKVKKLSWYHESWHILLVDYDKKKVIQEIVSFVRALT
jgi:carboxylesterase